MAIKTFTTGEVLTAADTNTYLANSGLVYVAGGALSGTSTTFTNCFSTTYDAYRVIIQAGGTTGNTLKLKWNGSTGSTYNTNGYYTIVGFSALNSEFESNNSGGIYLGYLSNSTSYFQADIRGPYLAQVTGVSAQFSGDQYQGTYSGIDKNTSSSTNLSVTAAVSLSGNISIYGYRKA